MLRLRFWNPAPGVRAFLIELLIVVLGVLIALGAQQLVDGWNTRREVAAFRTALNEELAGGLATYRFRIAQGPCLLQRLEELDAWQRDWRDGDGRSWLGAIGRPLVANPQAAVWQTGALDTAGQMPLDQRLAYADLYDSLENFRTLNFREVDAWYALFAFDGAKRLSAEEVNRLRGLILSAQWTDRSIELNYPRLLEAAAKLGIRPAPVPTKEIANRVAATQLCGSANESGTA